MRRRTGTLSKLRLEAMVRLSSSISSERSRPSATSRVSVARISGTSSRNELELVGGLIVGHDLAVAIEDQAAAAGIGSVRTRLPCDRSE